MNQMFAVEVAVAIAPAEAVAILNQIVHEFVGAGSAVVVAAGETSHKLVVRNIASRYRDVGHRALACSSDCKLPKPRTLRQVS